MPWLTEVGVETSPNCDESPNGNDLRAAVTSILSGNVPDKTQYPLWDVTLNGNSLSRIINNSFFHFYSSFCFARNKCCLCCFSDIPTFGFFEIIFN